MPTLQTKISTVAKMQAAARRTSNSTCEDPALPNELFDLHQALCAIDKLALATPRQIQGCVEILRKHASAKRTTARAVGYRYAASVWAAVVRLLA